MRATLLVEFYAGRWRINLDGEWYGSFPTQMAAEYASLELARSSGEQLARVAVRSQDGSESVLYDPLVTIEHLWQDLQSNIQRRLTGPSDIHGLRDEIVRRVLECAEFALSDDDTIDVVLASFGISRCRVVH